MRLFAALERRCKIPPISMRLTPNMSMAVDSDNGRDPECRPTLWAKLGEPAAASNSIIKRNDTKPLQLSLMLCP
jgi:hypothetical protein